MSIQKIMQAAQAAPERAFSAPESSSLQSVHDSVEHSRADITTDCGLIPQTICRSGFPENAAPSAGSMGNIPSLSDSTGVHGESAPAAGSIKASESREKESVTVEINRWVVARNDTSYIINTGGCGAIKIFVDDGKSGYSIVFHSFGSQDSKNAAGQIGSYILSRKEKPESVKILNIQPFGMSADVNSTVNVISDMIKKEGGIEIGGRAICLNNIDGEKYSKFVCLDMEGTEKQILDRCEHLILKDREMSKDERAMKIKLFQSLPLSARTPEFLRKWSTLSLEEARQLIDGPDTENTPFSRLRDKLGSTIKKMRRSLTGSKGVE